MRKLVVGGMLAFVVGLAPVAVMAQAPGFDDQTIATAQFLTEEVAPIAAPGYYTFDDSQVSGEVVGAPVPETEGAESEPQDPPVELPELNLNDLSEYESQGVTIQAPADWTVEADSDPNSPFIVEVPGTELNIQIQSDDSVDFPSWLAVALFRSQSDLILQSFGVDAQVDESTTLYTPQNLPIAKLAFSGAEDDQVSSGVIYATAPSDTVYLVVGVGSDEEWAYAAPGVEAIVKSLTFDDDLVTTAMADNGPLDMTDVDETVQVTVPDGWYALATNQTQYPIILVEPEARYVVAVATQDSLGQDFDPVVVDQLIPENGELSEEAASDLLDTVTDAMAGGDIPFNIDRDASSVIAKDGGLTIRLVGESEVEEGINIPVVLYVQIDPDGMTVAAVFGDTESAAAIEDVIQGAIDSITIL